MSEEKLGAYLEFYENLNPKKLPDINMMFDADAIFQDPFNLVRGHDAIERIFEKLLIDHPRTKFKIDECISKDKVTFITWSFMPNRDKKIVVEGSSRIEFNSTGKVIEHRDYWDTASELFVQIPILKYPVRWLLNRMQACHTDQIKKQNSV